jgi:hypothetical protein
MADNPGHARRRWLHTDAVPVFGPPARRQGCRRPSLDRSSPGSGRGQRTVASTFARGCQYVRGAIISRHAPPLCAIQFDDAATTESVADALRDNRDPGRCGISHAAEAAEANGIPALRRAVSAFFFVPFRRPTRRLGVRPLGEVGGSLRRGVIRPDGCADLCRSSRWRWEVWSAPGARPATGDGVSDPPQRSWCSFGQRDVNALCRSGSDVDRWRTAVDDRTVGRLSVVQFTVPQLTEMF